jgi:hypothetical protein
MTEEQAYEHGFYGTLTLNQMPNDEALLAAFEQGERDEQEIAAAEMAHEAYAMDLYGH